MGWQPRQGRRTHRPLRRHGRRDAMSGERVRSPRGPPLPLPCNRGPAPVRTPYCAILDGLGNFLRVRRTTQCARPQTKEKRRRRKPHVPAEDTKPSCDDRTATRISKRSLREPVTRSTIRLFECTGHDRDPSASRPCIRRHGTCAGISFAKCGSGDRVRPSWARNRNACSIFRGQEQRSRGQVRQPPTWKAFGLSTSNQWINTKIIGMLK